MKTKVFYIAFTLLSVYTWLTALWTILFTGILFFTVEPARAPQSFAEWLDVMYSIALLPTWCAISVIAPGLPDTALLVSATIVFMSALFACLWISLIILVDTLPNHLR